VLEVAGGPQLRLGWVLFYPFIAGAACMLLPCRLSGGACQLILSPPHPLCPSPPCRYARTHFPSTRYLDYAITVEEYTLQKVGGNAHRIRSVTARSRCKSAAAWRCPQCTGTGGHVLTPAPCLSPFCTPVR
jgi:hypothetical protein